MSWNWKLVVSKMGGPGQTLKCVHKKSRTDAKMCTHKEMKCTRKNNLAYTENSR